MRKVNYFLFVMLVFCIPALSQTSTEHINIKGGSSAWENFIKEVYLYPEFEPGILEYKNGKQYKSNFNYNKVLGTIQFISEKGDTLVISNEEAVNTITIGQTVFFFTPTPACMQQLKDAGKMKLVKNERVRIADKQKIGGYGIPNSTGSIEAIDRIDTRMAYNEIDINENLLLNKTISFFLEVNENEFLPASKKNFLNLFPKKADAIKEYIKSKQINFSKEDDLVELTGYISQL